MRKENGIMYHIGDIGELSADARPTLGWNYASGSCFRKHSTFYSATLFKFANCFEHCSQGRRSTSGRRFSAPLHYKSSRNFTRVIRWSPMRDTFGREVSVKLSQLQEISAQPIHETFCEMVTLVPSGDVSGLKPFNRSAWNTHCVYKPCDPSGIWSLIRICDSIREEVSVTRLRLTLFSHNNMLYKRN